MSVFQPIDVSPFIPQARRFVAGLQNLLPITSIILDNWNSTEGQRTVRLIYGCTFTEICGSSCKHCPLFKFVGADKVGEEPDFVTSLCEATDPHHRLLGQSSQKFLNCKTISQYQEAFVRYVVAECLTREKMAAELKWIKGFRLIFLAQAFSVTDLIRTENRIREKIAIEIVKRLRLLGDIKRVDWVLNDW